MEITLRNKLNKALKLKNIKKSLSMVKLLGCNIEEFKEYMESLFIEGMNWNNHTVRGWHIDHKKPIASFNLTDPEQQRVCFHYSNLQPLWWYDNLKKGSNYILIGFEA